MVPSMYGEVEDEAKDCWGRRRDDERLQQRCWMMTEYMRGPEIQLCSEYYSRFRVDACLCQAVTVTRHLVHSVQHSLLQPHAAPAGRFKQLERFWKREL